MRSVHLQFVRLRALRCVCVAIACLGAAALRAQIYVSGGTDVQGGVVLSNHPSPATPVLLLSAESTVVALAAQPADAVVAGIVRPPAVRRPSPAVAALINGVARDFAVAEALVKAVIAAESGFEPNARSRKGAMGLMQLMPETARRFGAHNPFAVEDNVRAGTAYLRWLLDFFAGDVQLALAAYNAGEGAVMRAGRRIPDIAETRAYVPKVLSYLAHYDADSPAP